MTSIRQRVPTDAYVRPYLNPWIVFKHWVLRPIRTTYMTQSSCLSIKHIAGPVPSHCATLFPISVSLASRYSTQYSMIYAHLPAMISSPIPTAPTSNKSRIQQWSRRTERRDIQRSYPPGRRSHLDILCSSVKQDIPLRNRHPPLRTLQQLQRYYSTRKHTPRSSHNDHLTASVLFVCVIAIRIDYCIS